MSKYAEDPPLLIKLLGLCAWFGIQGLLLAADMNATAGLVLGASLILLWLGRADAVTVDVVEVDVEDRDGQLARCLTED